MMGSVNQMLNSLILSLSPETLGHISRENNTRYMVSLKRFLQFSGTHQNDVFVICISALRYWSMLHCKEQMSVVSISIVSNVL